MRFNLSGKSDLKKCEKNKETKEKITTQETHCKLNIKHDNKCENSINNCEFCPKK